MKKILFLSIFILCIWSFFVQVDSVFAQIIGTPGESTSISNMITPPNRGCGTCAGETDFEIDVITNDGVYVYVESEDPKPKFGFDDDDDDPARRDPRAYERWRLIGDVGMYGDGYDYRNVPCAPGDDDRYCNASCMYLDFWSCDTRQHDRPATVDILVNGVVYDTILPTIAAPHFTNMSWANQSRYQYTPSCGDSPGNLYKYMYHTPVAWKDGRTRTVQLRSRVADANINNEYYRSNNHRGSYTALTNAQLTFYGVTNSSSVRYYFMYTDSTAPTTAILPNAGWDQANKDGDSNDITSFSITCPVLPGQVMDLTGQLGNIPDRVVNRAYNQSATIRNLGDAGSGGSIPVQLQYDYGRNGFTAGRNNDFVVNTTLGALTAGASGNATFNGITHTLTGPWQVRLLVDPERTRETNNSTRNNNTTGWQRFNVTVAPGTPVVDLIVADSSVTVNEDIYLFWSSDNIQPGTCNAGGTTWTGRKADDGSEAVRATTAGTQTYTLTCTGTNGQRVSDTVTVQVISNIPDLLFSSITYDTCTPAEQNQDTGVCPNTTVSLRIKNQGTGFNTGFNIPYRLERLVNGVWTAVSGASGTVPGLGAGAQSAVINLNVPNLPAGVSQRFRAQVNQPNTNLAIGETRFSNNATTTPYFTIAPVPPDYRFDSFTVATCPTTDTQNMITGVCPESEVRFVIENVGANTPSGQRITYRVEKQNSNGSWSVVSGGVDDIGGLAANARSGTVIVRVPNLDEGTHRFRARVNHPVDADLYESNTANNISPERAFTVPALPPQCNNNRDDNDPEDTLADEDDPACWNDITDPSTYNPNLNNETEAIPAPTLTMVASPNIVRYNSPASITYTIESIYDVECRLTGPGMPASVITYKPAVPMEPQTRSHDSASLSGTQRFTISCTALGGSGIANPLSGTASVSVDVIPQAQEI